MLDTKLDFTDSQKPGALAQLYSLLPQHETFILSGTCGNVDDSTGNPLKNVMFSKIGNAIEYHPISVAFHHGLSKLNSFKIINENLPSLPHNIYSNAFILLSKRSFVPAIDDYQIKTSFPAQISSEIRTIDWSTAHDIMYSSNIVEQLAQKQLLPNNFWVQLTQYTSQANHDD
jgi:hypothetical protein